MPVILQDIGATVTGDPSTANVLFLGTGFDDQMRRVFRNRADPVLTEADLDVLLDWGIEVVPSEAEGTVAGKAFEPSKKSSRGVAWVVNLFFAVVFVLIAAGAYGVYLIVSGLLGA